MLKQTTNNLFYSYFAKINKIVKKLIYKKIIPDWLFYIQLTMILFWPLTQDIQRIWKLQEFIWSWHYYIYWLIALLLIYKYDWYIKQNKKILITNWLILIFNYCKFNKQLNLYNHQKYTIINLNFYFDKIWNNLMLNVSYFAYDSSFLFLNNSLLHLNFYLRYILFYNYYIIDLHFKLNFLKL